LARLEHLAGGDFAGREGFGGGSDYRLPGFEDVQTNHALPGVQQRKADEIERYQAVQEAAEIGKQGRELAVGRNGFGHLEQGLIASAVASGGVGTGEGMERRAGFSSTVAQPGWSEIS